jgi:glyoxylase-like metal-dependent hydrolase (beta-lactamase superfamily II)
MTPTSLRQKISIAMARLLLAGAFACGAGIFAQVAEDAVYEVYAIRFGTLPQFPVSGLVAGADESRRIDIPVMVWLLKGSNGKRVLVDSGFHQQKFVDQWKVQSFRSPAEAVAAAGIKASEITDIIITHAHWDHVGGVDLFPDATVWIQRDEYAYYTGEAWHARNTHGGIDPTHMAVLLELNTKGRLRFVNGDDRAVLPGIRCYTGGRHTYASQYVGVQTSGGTAVITSDNMYLYENLEKRVPIAQTLDAASNLRAQDRIRSLARDLSLIVPGHDPAVFERYPRVAEGVVRIK